LRPAEVGITFSTGLAEGETGRTQCDWPLRSKDWPPKVTGFSLALSPRERSELFVNALSRMIFLKDGLFGVLRKATFLIYHYL